MSSFKRRVTSKQASSPTGTRIVPGPVPTYVTSTGIPSLDDILGSGLPLACTQLILAPDVHSAYGELVQKYFVAQGLACGQDVCVIDDNAREFVAECMWIPGGSTPPNINGSASPSVEAEEDEEQTKDHDTKIKIAWRYEQMKQFQTTVQTSTQYVASFLSLIGPLGLTGLYLFRFADDYCQVFDLTSRISPSTVESTSSSGQLDLEDVSSPWSEQLSTTRILTTITALLGEEEKDIITRKPLRICIPSLGSQQWGDLRPQASPLLQNIQTGY